MIKLPEFVRCFEANCLCKSGHNCRCSECRDILRQLSADIAVLNKQKLSCDHGQRLKITHEVSEDVQKQMRSILEVVDEMTGERPCHHHHGQLSTEEAMEPLELFLAEDLLIHLVEELPALDFEARKDVMNVFSVLLRPGLPVLATHMVGYVRRHTQMAQVFMDGCDNSEIALHCGVMLRSCARHVELAEVFLESGMAYTLLEQVLGKGFDVSTDAFGSLRELLLGNKDMTKTWLMTNFVSFFSLYHRMFETGEYVILRQSLKLLGDMLLDRSFVKVMLRYVSEEKHLVIHMNFLLSSSVAIQYEAFNLFKIFVANPQKPPRIQKILCKNRAGLLDLLANLRSHKSEDERFLADEKNVSGKLRALKMPVNAQRCGDSNVAARASVPDLYQLAGT